MNQSVLLAAVAGDLSSDDFGSRSLLGNVVGVFTVKMPPANGGKVAENSAHVQGNSFTIVGSFGDDGDEATARRSRTACEHTCAA